MFLQLTLLLAALALPSTDSPTVEVCAELIALQEERTVDRSRLDRLDDGEILVSLQELPAGRLKEGVALFRIDAPADLVFDVVTDHEAFPGTIPYVAEIGLRHDESGPIVYQLLDLPFPITDRHYEIRVERVRLSGAKGRCAESRWRYLEGSGNIDDTFGRWEVLELDAERTLVAYLVWVDPGGLVPSWAQNWASKRALPRLAEAVRTEVQRRAAGTR